MEYCVVPGLILGCLAPEVLFSHSSVCQYFRVWFIIPFLCHGVKICEEVLARTRATSTSSISDREDRGSACLHSSTQATSRGTVVPSQCLLNISSNEWLALSRPWGPPPRILQRSAGRWSANSFNQRLAPEMLVNSDLAVTFQPLCTQIITSDCKGVAGAGGDLLGSQKDLFSIVGHDFN